MREIFLFVAAALSLSSPHAKAIEAPVTGCIDVLAGQRRVATWIRDCDFPDETHTKVLERVLAVVRHAISRGEKPVLVFDLDSTLYDTGPRAHASLRAVLRDHGGLLPSATREKLEAIERFRWFSVPEAFEAQGLSMLDPVHAQAWKAIAPYWFDHYRSEAMVALDVLYRGAGEYVRKAYDAGATLAYVTGRQRVLMERSTKAALVRDGLPYGLDARAHLFMKGPEERRDIEFKRATVQHVRLLGTVVATFDNEPGNVVTFADAFPDAVNVFVDTVASDKEQPPRAGLARISRWD